MEYNPFGFLNSTRSLVSSFSEKLHDTWIVLIGEWEINGHDIIQKRFGLLDYLSLFLPGICLTILVAIANILIKISQFFYDTAIGVFTEIFVINLSNQSENSAFNLLCNICISFAALVSLGLSLPFVLAGYAVEGAASIVSLAYKAAAGIVFIPCFFIVGIAQIITSIINSCSGDNIKYARVNNKNYIESDDEMELNYNSTTANIFVNILSLGLTDIKKLHGDEASSIFKYRPDPSERLINSPSDIQKGIPEGKQRFNPDMGLRC